MTLLGLVYDSTVALVICLAALGLGWLALRSMRLHAPRMTTIWLATTCGLGLLSVGTLLLGLAGLLYPLVFAILLAPLVLYGLVIVFRTDWWRTIRVWLQSRKQGTLFRIGADLLLLVSAGTVVWIFLTHALMPPHEWDEIAYHLTLPKLYIQEHRIGYISYIVTANWPLNNEMLFVIALLFGSDIAPHLLMLSMSLLIAFGLLIVARHYFDDRIGIVAVALFLSIPLVKRLSGTGLIDVSLGLYVLAALFTFYQWQQTRRWPWLVLCGAMCGFVAGSKLTGGAFAILIGLLLLGDAVRQRPFQMRSILNHGLLFGLAGLVIVGPWYARSLFFTGNPIWPFGYHIFGGRDWDALGDEYHMYLHFSVWTIDVPRTPTGFLSSFVYLFTDPSALGGYHGGIGVIVPLGAIWAVMLLAYAPRILRQSLFICAGFYILWFTLLSVQIRYLLPIAPLLTLAAAYTFMWFYQRVHIRPGRALLIVGLLFIVFHESPWINPAERALFTIRRPYLQGQVSRTEWLETQIDSLPLFEKANTELPANARILLFPYENRTYYLDRDYIWGNPFSQRIIPFEQFDSVEELATRLQGMGITHVIDNTTWMYEGIPYWQQIRDLMLALKDACGQTLYEHDEGVLYEITECETAVQVPR